MPLECLDVNVTYCNKNNADPGDHIFTPDTHARMFDNPKVLTPWHTITAVI